jgi:uncharacterized membrane protein
VIWIGGVAMATTVVLPAVREGALGENRLRAFQAIEKRFGRQARGTVIVVGLTGLYMTWRLNLWNRSASGRFWWMHAMVCLWLLFAFILFIGEPVILQRRLRAWATKWPEVTFAWLHRVHWVLLALSFVTVLGAVAGSRGWSVF